jgi:hypothetical protein
MSQEISGHTKGPWVVDDSSGARCYIRQNIHQVGLMAVAQVCKRPWSEQQANARLIADAPDMLAALEVAEREIIDAIEAQTGREFTERDATRALHKVRAAIAKART